MNTTRRQIISLSLMTLCCLICIFESECSPADVMLAGSVVKQENNRQVSTVVDSSSESWWNLSRLWSWFDGNSESGVAEGRTFGRIRKLQAALIPIMFKFGILSTMIFLLVFLGVKSVFLLKTLLILNLGFLLAKLFAWKAESGGGHHSLHGGGLSSLHALPIPWTAAPQQKEIHLHLHNGGVGGGGVHEGGHKWENEPYGAYSQQHQVQVHRQVDDYPSVNHKTSYSDSYRRQSNY